MWRNVAWCAGVVGGGVADTPPALDEISQIRFLFFNLFHHITRSVYVADVV